MKRLQVGVIIAVLAAACGLTPARSVLSFEFPPDPARPPTVSGLPPLGPLTLDVTVPQPPPDDNIPFGTLLVTLMPPPDDNKPTDTYMKLVGIAATADTPAAIDFLATPPPDDGSPPPDDGMPGVSFFHVWFQFSPPPDDNLEINHYFMPPPDDGREFNVFVDAFIPGVGTANEVFSFTAADGWSFYGVQDPPDENAFGLTFELHDKSDPFLDWPPTEDTQMFTMEMTGDFTVIPLPPAAGLGLLGLAMLGWWKRRRARAT